MMPRRGPRTHPPAGLPRVNLLSASAFAQLAAHDLRRRFLVAGVGLVVLVATAGTLQHLRVAEAGRVLAAEQLETTRLGTDNQALAPVRAFVAGVELQQQTVESNMAPEVYTSDVLRALLDAAPPGVRLDTLTLTVAAAQADPAGGAAAVPAPATCPGPDPFNTRTAIGCVTLSGTAASRAEVGDLVISLGDVGLFVEPFISTTTTVDTTGVTFSGSVGLSRAAFSGRFGLPAKSVAEGLVE
jgi:hypothetical protein